MKVIIDSQMLTDKKMRGMNYYAQSLINALLRRNMNDYELTVFDYNRERGNRERLLSRLDYPDRAIVRECNTLSYATLMREDAPFSANEDYKTHTGTSGDVYHFLSQEIVPPQFRNDLVVTIHDMIPYLFKNEIHWTTLDRFTRSWRRICEYRPFIITDSESSKCDIIKFDPALEEKVFVIPLAYDNRTLYHDPDIARLQFLGINKHYILYVGTLEIRKGVTRLVTAFNVLRQNLKDIELVVVCPHKGQDIADLMLSMANDKDRVKFLENVSEDEKRTLMSCASVFAFPSFYEGFGLPPLEAMACGCPVITSNTSSLPEVVGDAAIMIDPTNTEQLAYEMERVLLSEALRRDLIAKGYENCKRFSWSKTAEMTENVYLERFARR